MIYALLGHNKCATTYLRDLLAGHPDVKLIKGEVLNGMPSYKRLDRADLAGGTGFICHPFAIQQDDLLREIVDTFGDVKALAVYRDPIDVIISMHAYMRRSMKRGDLQDVGLTKKIQIPYIEDRELYNSIKSGALKEVCEDRFSYDLNAARLRKYFKKEDILEILYEDFISDLEGALEKVTSFMGIEIGGLKDFKDRKNISYYPKSQFFYQAISWLSARITGLNSPGKHFDDHPGKRCIFCALYRLNMKRPKKILSKDEYAELKEIYRPLAERFAAASGLDIGKWGYR